MTLLLSASHRWSLEEEIKRPHLSPPRLVSDPALSSSSWIFTVFINMKTDKECDIILQWSCSQQAVFMYVLLTPVRLDIETQILRCQV